MTGYSRDRKRVDSLLRKCGIVVVMNKNHVQTAEHMVITMKSIYDAGLVAEVTFRIDEGILREGMKELVKLCEQAPSDKPFVLGVGSVINPHELESALEMGFDMIVAPANVMGGYAESCELVRIAHQANVFVAPAIFTPTELNYFLERNDGLEPDAIKIFPAGVHGPKGFSDLLAPFVRTRHKGKIIMPTGGVDYETGPKYIEAISQRGFFPVLGMSAPLKLVEIRKKPGDIATIVESLQHFKTEFEKKRQITAPHHV